MLKITTSSVPVQSSKTNPSQHMHLTSSKSNWPIKMTWTWARTARYGTTAGSVCLFQFWTPSESKQMHEHYTNRIANNPILLQIDGCTGPSFEITWFNSDFLMMMETRGNGERRRRKQVETVDNNWSKTPKIIFHSCFFFLFFYLATYQITSFGTYRAAMHSESWNSLTTLLTKHMQII